MDIELKHKIAEKIIQSNDEELLNEIKSLIGLSESDFWTKLPPELKESIKIAKNELDEGKGIPHDEVMFEIRG